MQMNLTQAKKIIKKYRNKKGGLIPLLQNIQSSYGYVPKESVDLIAKELSIYPVRIYEVLTFYTQFHLLPRGKYTIKVCQGTACHVMGGKEILEYLSHKLKVAQGGTTQDGLFSLERVACLGCCGIAPVAAINDKFYGKLTVQKLDKILNEYKEKK